MLNIKKALFLTLITLCNLACADIPEKHVKAINSIVKADSIEPLAGGFSSPGLYKISVDGKNFVVRFSSDRRSLKDRERELDAMQISAKRGLAPKIIYANAQEGIIIMEFISSERRNLKLLAQGIHKIHEGPDFKETTSFFDLIKSFQSELKGEKPPIIYQASSLLDQLQANIKYIQKPCHNDLNPNNLIYTTEQVYFIDWEMAGQGDPFLDLATPVVLYNMNAEQERTFLKAYFQRYPSPDEFSKFQKMKKVASIYYGFALIWISQKHCEDFITSEEIENLPDLGELLKGDIRKFTYREIQCLGFAFLREALR